MSSPDLRLRVNGLEYAGWKSARIVRSLEAISGGFELEVSERRGGQNVPWPIHEEDECWLISGGEGLIAGYVDQRSSSFGAADHSMSVSGKDRTAALVECSAVLPQWEFLNTSVLTLAKRLAAPFGIDVSLQPGIAPPATVAKLTIDPGETAFEALERACRMAGLLAVADAAGGLVLTRAGATRAATELVEGKNILDASCDSDATGRFRSYRVMGQHQGTDEFEGAAAAAVLGTARDTGVRRKERVLLLRADGNCTPGQAKRRAQWEATVRAARGHSVQVTVQGWRQGDGRLWPVNALVRLRSPFLEIDSDMLITEVEHSLDNSSGTTTRLSLKRPDAYLPEPTKISGNGVAPWLSGAPAPVDPFLDIATQSVPSQEYSQR